MKIKLWFTSLTGVCFLIRTLHTEIFLKMTKEKKDLGVFLNNKLNNLLLLSWGEKLVIGVKIVMDTCLRIKYFPCFRKEKTKGTQKFEWIAKVEYCGVIGINLYIIPENIYLGPNLTSTEVNVKTSFTSVIWNGPLFICIHILKCVCSTRCTE